MPKYSGLSGKKLIRMLEGMGFKRKRQQGSHVVLKKKTSEGSVGCVVPLHKELAVGTLRGILRQAKISIDDLQ